MDTVSGLAERNITWIFFSTYDSLEYRFRKGHLKLSFLRAMTPGSGVLLGSQTNWAEVTFTRKIGRSYSGSLHLGRSDNRPLLEGVLTRQPAEYEAWEGGASMNRKFGRHTSIYLNYSMQRQNSNDPLCFSDSCGNRIVRHVVGIGITWQGGPLKFD